MNAHRNLGPWTAAVVLLLAGRSTSAADWPMWRGPTGMGRTTEKDLPLTWGGKTKQNVLWQTPLPGGETASQDHNQSSPVVVGSRVFVTVSYWPGKTDAAQFPEHHVACYSANDGKPVWDVRVPPGPWKLSDLRGGYTAPTPAADADHVYVVFGSAVIAALDHAGQEVWRKEIVPYKFDVAMAASPVLIGDTVVLQCDELDKQSRLIAYDRKTGDVKWEEKRPGVGFAHSTPVLATVGTEPQLLLAASNAVQGVDPTSGKVLWTCDAKGDTASPLLAGGLVYLDSGRGGSGLAVDPTGKGNVTKTHVKWTAKNVSEGYSSPAADDEYLYRLHKPELLTCRKLSTGEVIYSERLDGMNTSTSPILTPDGRLYLVSGGKSYVMKAGPKFEVLAANDLGDIASTSAAVADGRLFIKGKKFLTCIDGKK
ncbi:PQQ-binding-like beta-propeller repeat protein [Limnoglobus roseus]|uniref:Serine/threonine protein kinase n=1 Tax=Limnoglobus roseus TaxID=2598579 RepID=A0A5C1ACQ6_9BACT|nr:PQQ-binding-like beta-propeller repeat protein [Limnoglobus roseus]QEL15983.1 serine/threonine protein kinase [Limnoglobus roseus]